jgi:phage baseplate assembly protein W
MKFLGAPYPITVHPRGLLHVQHGIEQVKSDLLQLLLTNPGERVMLPDYGTPLNTLIFEQNDDLLADSAKQMIINSIQMWEPRITVSQIDVSNGVSEDELNPLDTKTDIDHILSIKILFFDPENMKEVQELRLEVPLASATTPVNVNLNPGVTNA